MGCEGARLELKAEIGFWVVCDTPLWILDCDIMLPLSVSDVRSEIRHELTHQMTGMLLHALSPKHW